MTISPNKMRNLEVRLNACLLLPAAPIIHARSSTGSAVSSIAMPAAHAICLLDTLKDALPEFA